MTSIATSTEIANEVPRILAELAKTTEPLMLTGGPLFTGPDQWTRSVESLGGTPAERFRAAIDEPEYFWFASWYDVDGNVIPRSDRGPEWEEAELEGAPVGRLRTTKNAIWTTTSGHLFVSQGLWTPREETTLDGKPADQRFTRSSYPNVTQRAERAASAREGAHSHGRAANVRSIYLQSDRTTC